MLKPVGLIHGHYECRSLDETLPIFADLLALEIVERKDGQVSFIFSDLDRNWWEVVGTEDGGPRTGKIAASPQALAQETTSS